MKKIGFLIFAVAIVVGVLVTSLFSFGRISEPFFRISLGNKIKGSGNVVTETREVRDFKGVDVSGVFQVEIVAQKDFSVEVEADDNLIPLVRTEVRGGVLHIETERRISTNNGLKVRIAAPDISDIDASGAAKVNLSSAKSDELSLHTSGASKINVSGEAAKFFVKVSGASNIDAANLSTVDADIDASGASKVSIFATGDLRMDASGASKILYSGNPKNVDKSSSGASSVREQ